MSPDRWFMAVALLVEAAVILILWLRRDGPNNEAQRYYDAWKRESARAGKAEASLRELEEVILVQAEAIKRRRGTKAVIAQTEQLLSPPSPRPTRVRRGDCPQS